MTVQEFRTRMIELEERGRECQDRINEATKVKRNLEREMLSLKEQLLEALLVEANGKKK